MNRKKTPEWRRYKRLLRQYREAVEAWTYKGALPPSEWAELDQAVRKATMQMDAFQLTRMFLSDLPRTIEVGTDTATKQGIGGR
jgi:hypothetical protein